MLDDIWNPVNVGSYYLGSNGDWYLVDDIINLINTIVEDSNINQVITIGSSKGGSSALYYGIKIKADFCIIGAPQYHVGTYLSSVNHYPIMDVIIGNHYSESINKLNCYILDEIFNHNSKKPKIFIHYSPKEHTYQDHIKDLIKDLNEAGYEIKEDNDYYYEKHSDVKDFFPNYLISTL